MFCCDNSVDINFYVVIIIMIVFYIPCLLFVYTK